MKVEPLTVEHLARFAPNERQRMIETLLPDRDFCEGLIKGGPCFAATIGDVPVCCAGVIVQWENRAAAWAFLATESGPWMLQVHRAVKRFLGDCGIRRIEAAVDIEFPAALRWIEMLGFEREGVARFYTPDGRTCAQYARIKEART